MTISIPGSTHKVDWLTRTLNGPLRCSTCVVGTLLRNPASESILETSSLDIFFETICHALQVNASTFSFNFVPNNIQNILSLGTTSLSLAFFLQTLTRIFFRSYLTSSNHLFLGFPVEFFSPGYTETLSSRFFFSRILSTYPPHRYLPSIISETMSGSLYIPINSCLVRILHAPLYCSGPNIFLKIFLSHTAKVFHSFCSVSRLPNHTLLPILLLSVSYEGVLISPYPDLQPDVVGRNR